MRNSSRYFALLEVLVALSIMSVLLIAVSLALYDLPRVVMSAQETLGALTRARTILAHATSSLSLTNKSASTTDGIYTTSFSVFPQEDESFFEVRAYVAWKNAFGVSQSETLSQLVTDPSVPSHTCDPFVSGDWTHPFLVGSYALPGTLAAITTTPLVLAVALASTSLQTPPTALLYRVHGSDAPNFIAGFDNATSSRIGFSSISEGDGYIFAGNAFSSASSATCASGTNCAQVQTFSLPTISTPVPSRVGSITFSTSSPPYAFSSDAAPSPVRSLTYYHHYLFVGLQKTVRGSEFNIVDAQDPTHLIWLSGYRVGRTVNHIAVRGAYAFISTDDPGQELLILNIHDLAHPKVESVWDAPGSQSFGYGAASTSLPPFIRFGRTYSSNAPELYSLDMSDPFHIQILNSSDSGTAKDPESVRSLLTQGSLTFSLLTHRVEFWSTGNSGELAALMPSYVLPLGIDGVSLTCRNNLLYIGGNGADGMGIITVLRGA